MIDGVLMRCQRTAHANCIRNVTAERNVHRACGLDDLRVHVRRKVLVNFEQIVTSVFVFANASFGGGDVAYRVTGHGWTPEDHARPNDFAGIDAFAQLKLVGMSLHAADSCDAAGDIEESNPLGKLYVLSWNMAVHLSQSRHQILAASIDTCCTRGNRDACGRAN